MMEFETKKCTGSCLITQWFCWESFLTFGYQGPWKGLDEIIKKIGCDICGPFKPQPLQ